MKKVHGIWMVNAAGHVSAARRLIEKLMISERMDRTDIVMRDRLTDAIAPELDKMLDQLAAREQVVCAACGKDWTDRDGCGGAINYYGPICPDCWKETQGDKTDAVVCGDDVQFTTFVRNHDDD
jgi:hypothetical protein